MTERQTDEFPDVLGMLLEKGEEILALANLSFEIQETAPNRGKPIDGNFRIIKQENQTDKVTLTVCKIPDAFQEK